MSVGTIKIPKIHIRPSAELIQFIKSLTDPKLELTHNIHEIYKSHTGDKHNRKILQKEIPKEILTKDDNQILSNLSKTNETDDDTKLKSYLQKLSLEYESEDETADEDIETLSADKVIGKNEAKRDRAKQKEKLRKNLYLDLNDMKWLHGHLNVKRKTNESTKYLHELLAGSKLILPKNEIIERNPELEARCQRLRREQEARDYHAMTKNVDCSRQHAPDETISYQS